MVNKVTYNQMEKVLVGLGFEEVKDDTYTAFKNTECDAIIVLPKGTAMSVVSPVHLLTIERTVVGRGVASLDTFTRRLANVHRSPAAKGRIVPRRKPRLKGQSVQTAPVIK